MNNSKIFLIFFLITTSIINLSNKNILANQKNNYTITSDTQKQSEDGVFQAFGNVIINNESNLSAKADKLIYEKEQSRIYLKGNVKIENFKSENIFIENIVGDELILFTNRSGFEINSKNGNRVKSNLKF